MTVALEAVLKVMKCVVWSEKASPQGTSEMVPLSGTYRALSFGWNAAPGSFLSKPFGQSCFGSWPALGTRAKAYGPGHLAPALPNNPNQSLRHASALLRQPLIQSIGFQTYSNGFSIVEIEIRYRELMQL